MSLTSLLEFAGTFAFAVSGALAAIEKKLDPFGVLILAFVTAIGGGTIRDILIGSLPVAWLTNGAVMLVILCAAAITWFFGGLLRKLERVLLIFDAVGLALFTLTGIKKGLLFGFDPPVCIALGTITATFGGVIRDVLLSRIPFVFQKEIYASASIAGGMIFQLLLTYFPQIQGLAEVIAVTAIVLIRLLAVLFNWSLKAR